MSLVRLVEIMIDDRLNFNAHFENTRGKTFKVYATLAVMRIIVGSPTRCRTTIIGGCKDGKMYEIYQPKVYQHRQRKYLLTISEFTLQWYHFSTATFTLPFLKSFFVIKLHYFCNVLAFM